MFYSFTCTHRDIFVYKIFNEIWIHKFVLLNLQLCQCLSFCPSIFPLLITPLVSSKFSYVRQLSVISCDHFIFFRLYFSVYIYGCTICLIPGLFYVYVYVYTVFFGVHIWLYDMSNTWTFLCLCMFMFILYFYLVLHPKGCSDLKNKHSKSGVYRIYPDNVKPFKG